MRHALALTLLLTSGCASIFTGSKQRITIETDPPGALIVVVGTPAAPILLALDKGDRVAQKIVGLLSPVLSEGARQRLAGLALPELIAKVGAWARLDQVPPELVGEATTRIPGEIRGALLDVLGIKEVGVSPMKVKLRKGRDYAVIAYHEGYGGRIAGIHPKFNWVTLLNVFNAFLGVPIDALTGAWFNLSPGTVRLTLPPRAAG